MTSLHGKIKGWMAAIAAAALFAGAASLCAPLFSHAQAAEAPALFIPSSYEQYLELDAPSWAAFSARHIAVVDGRVLYTYDRETEAYRETALENDATQIGFSGERLFLSDRSAGTLGFYEYDFEENALTKISDINCSTFCIDGDTLYTATVAGSETSIGKYSISALGAHNRAESLGTVAKQVTPNLTVRGGTLYCAFEAAVYYVSDGKIDVGNPFWLSENPSDVENVNAVCAFGEDFYYTARGGLYRMGAGAPLIEAENLGYLFAYGERLYTVVGSAIKEIAVDGEGAHFTDYEIASRSESKNRLNEAVDMARAGDLTVTADAGNRRVSVYDSGKGRFRNIPLASTPTLVSTDGELIAAAAGSRIYYGTDSLDDFMQTDETVLGLACVYGYTYYVTETDYGCIAPDGTQTEVFHSGHGAPAALTADAYGDLFVAMSNREVYRFAEQDFLDGAASGELVFTLPEGYSSLHADSEGNLLYLVGDSLMQGGEETPLLTLGEKYVYTDSEAHPLAFALGFEDGEACFLFGNYAVKMNLPVCTLKTIAAENSYDEISRPHTADGVKSISVGKDEIGIRIDLSVLSENSEYFGYAGRCRIAEAGQGVVLAETAQHRLVSLYEGHESTVYLFRIDKKPLSPLPYEEKDSVSYLTNDVYLYHFPSLLLDGVPADGSDEVACTHSAEKLARGTCVEVRALAEAPERDYAYVACGEREGYVPLSYLTDVDPAESAEDEYLWGRLKKDTVFAAADGTEHTLRAGAEVRLTEDGEGYLARYTAEDGSVLTAHVSTGDIDWGENDALRIALIVILSVLALLIVGVYVYLLPRKPKSP